MVEFRRRRPTPTTLAWVADRLGGEVTSWRRLTGGLGSAVHLLRCGDGTSAVLRQYEHGAGAAWIEREAAALESVASTGLAVPALIAADPTGARAGDRPTLLMTRVPGAIDLTPDDLDSWLHQLAAAGASIHELDLEGPEFERWFDPGRFEVPADARDPGLWRGALDVLRGPEPSYDESFIHRDLQHFNVLWSGGELTGIIDWVSASRGPVEIDVGHCELNLAVLFGPEVAGRFRADYVRITGRTLDPWWELQSAASFSAHWPATIPDQVDGRRPVDLHGMTARVEGLVRRILSDL